uniref:ATP synthase F0 subunit 8 n=1 Tax=Allantus togatus TaxID=1384743 RepID=A0A895KU27_9HYME|nr:ATP synthase F0 subunit 8 [Allantus togatus]QRZ60640.1 ATP synthase F0 subunit 8 [Allantus togatus]
MPQMFPLNWIFLFIFFLFIFMNFYIQIFYHFNNKKMLSNSMLKIYKNKKLLIWKW